MTGEEDPGFTHCHEDATNLMCGLIGELSSLKLVCARPHVFSFFLNSLCIQLVVFLTEQCGLQDINKLVWSSVNIKSEELSLPVLSPYLTSCLCLKPVNKYIRTVELHCSPNV